MTWVSRYLFTEGFLLIYGDPNGYQNNLKLSLVILHHILQLMKEVWFCL